MSFCSYSPRRDSTRFVAHGFTDWLQHQGQTVPYCTLISLYGSVKTAAAAATTSRPSRSALVDRPTPFRHFSITALVAGCCTIIAGVRPLGALMKSHCERPTAAAKKWTTPATETRRGEKLNLSDEMRRRVERQLRDSVCGVGGHVLLR